MELIFFNGWFSLFRTTVIGIMAYVSLIFILRVSGNRTLSKMNAFDMVVTVSMGSTLATILLNKDVALTQGALAFALLTGMQFAVTWSSVRVSWIRKIVTGEPMMLLYQGAFLPTALLRARVTEDEVYAAIRSTGLEALDEVRAVVLETDGSFSVVRKSGGSGTSSLKRVRIPNKDAIPDL
ncbi:MAG: membrane protein [Desulfobulbaceae bacterium BRH_c16a]|nr:MAG: membrane protein [Desulfobulbaceae bacterium BRH_c16a]